MNQTIAIDCPAEILVSLHTNAKGLAGFTKPQAAITLFREARLSSGTAAAWLGVPHVTFLLRAMELSVSRGGRQAAASSRSSSG